MPLKAILDDISSTLGFESSQRPIVLARINQVADELYNSTDLIGCLREQVFDLSNTVVAGTASSQVSLPFYIGEIRGCRYYNSRLRITVNDMMPRYHYGIGNEIWGLRYRMLGKKALFQDITNESALIFSVPFNESNDFNITIIGQTANSYRVTETLFFSKTATTAQSVNNFKSVESIQKSIVTAYDVIVKDVETNLLATIPNTELFSAYISLQVLDTGDSSDSISIEILYKQRFSPYVNDFDEFPCGNKYDKVIFWKYLEHEAARGKDINGAQAAQVKANSLIQQIAEDAESGYEKEVDIAPNPYLDITPFTIGRYSRRLFPYWFR